MNVPERIELDGAARVLSVHWPGSGTRQALAHALLRAQCPCSACRRIRLHGGTIDIAVDTSIVGIAPMGYGIQLFFSDGHDRGIFPWPYLEQLASSSVMPIPQPPTRPSCRPQVTDNLVCDADPRAM
jgi:DUF971 family protein